MKTLFVAAMLVTSLGLAPAMAGEGNGDPFPSNTGNLTANVAIAPPLYADTGSQAYPTQPGRPGSDLPSLAGDVLPTNGSQGIVQTANSLPAHFEEGTVAYAQANHIRAWMLAHARSNAPAYASASRFRASGG